MENVLKQFERDSTTMNRAWWNLATTGDEKYVLELERAKIALRKLFSSKQDYEALKAAPASKDVLVERQKNLLLNYYKENQISSEMIETISKLEGDVESMYTNFRPEVNGKTLSNNDLKNILVESSDSSERESTWQASKLIGEKVEKDVLKLIELRNKSARDAGFSDFYSMQLELQELNQTSLFKLLDDLDKMTASAWVEYKTKLDESLAKRFGISQDKLMPWHYQDPFFQEAPKQAVDLDPYYAGKDIVAICAKYFKDIGLPVEDILDKSDLFEREKKNQHAFCACIDRKLDIRVLCNIREDEYWMGTMLHELGHAVYDKYIDQNLPFTLRSPSHTLTTEASAMLFGRLSRSGPFLERYVGLDKGQADTVDASSRKQNAANLLVFSRWVMVMVHFERMMYQEKGIDLNEAWWDLVERFQAVRRIPGRGKPDWASKLHIACAPVYYQNYILGEMFASQLLHHIGSLFSTHTGNTLKNRLYHPGASMPWNETIAFATGENLNPRYFALDIGIKAF